jgi:hypothetical protein
MSSLKMHDTVVFEKLFDRGGYVLDFTDAKFATFFREHNVDIEDHKYHKNGTSKMKRLRAFWEVEPDLLVGRVLEALLEYACVVEQVDDMDKKKALSIIHRLQGKATSQASKGSSEDDFLKKEFVECNITNLKLEPSMHEVILQRLDEVKKSIESNAPLAAIFLCGSILEGLLLDTATANSQSFNTAQSAPKSKEGKVLQFHEWKLVSLIEVAHELNMLSLDVKKHSHALRDFRNYIHPRQQIVNRFKPDMHTAKISWQVLKAAIADLSGQRTTKKGI